MIGKDYVLLDSIGQGAYGNVYKARHVLADQVVAIKVVPKYIKNSQNESINEIHMQNEISLFQKVDHPLISQFFDYFEDENNMYIVQECAENGMFLDYVNKSHGLTEGQSRFFFLQLLSIVEYLHDEMHIVHRDLKMENLLLDKNNNLRLIDFGLSHQYKNKSNHNNCNHNNCNHNNCNHNNCNHNNCNHNNCNHNNCNHNNCNHNNIDNINSNNIDNNINYDDDDVEEEVLTEACGTPAYVAPEVILRSGYGYQVDVWGLGILLYAMSCGKLPFYTEDINSLVRQIAFDPIVVPSRRSLSPEIRDLLDKMLKKNPNERIKLNEIREHPWLSSPTSSSAPSSLPSLSSPLLQQINNINNISQIGFHNLNNDYSDYINNNNNDDFIFDNLISNFDENSDNNYCKGRFHVVHHQMNDDLDVEILMKMCELGFDDSKLANDLANNIVNSETTVYKLLRKRKVTDELANIKQLGGISRFLFQSTHRSLNRNEDQAVSSETPEFSTSLTSPVSSSTSPKPLASSTTSSKLSTSSSFPLDGLGGLDEEIAAEVERNDTSSYIFPLRNHITIRKSASTNDIRLQTANSARDDFNEYRNYNSRNFHNRLLNGDDNNSEKSIESRISIEIDDFWFAENVYNEKASDEEEEELELADLKQNAKLNRDENNTENIYFCENERNENFGKHDEENNKMGKRMKRRALSLMNPESFQMMISGMNTPIWLI